MQYFKASTFFGLGKLLERIRAAHWNSVPEDLLSEKEKGALLDLLGLIHYECAMLELKFSIIQIERARQDLQEPITNRRIANLLDELEARIGDEMKGHLFLFVPEDKASFYDPKDPAFGFSVYHNFPSATYDIEEAAKCLALERNTACVYHLMRVVESGLKAVCKALQISYSANWGASIKQIDSQLQLKQALPSRKWKKDVPFFKEIAADLTTVKNAWRNPTMHLEKDYDSRRAEEIFQAVRAFMRNLSKRVKE